MLVFATIILAASIMATPPPSLPSTEEALSMMMTQFRSDEIPHVTRNGVTMMNPYFFRKGEDAKENQQLAITLLDKVYAAPVEDQVTLAGQLGLDNDNAGPFMVWDAFVTGHVDVYKALSTFLTRGIGQGQFEASVDKYLETRIQEVLQAPKESKHKAIEDFLRENSNDGPQLLFQAAVHGDETVISHLIAAGHEIHPKSHPTTMPLHAACYNDRMGAAQQLIRAGVDVNYLDEFGSTPLMRAAVGGNVELVKWLIQNGADAKLRETRAHGSTALELGVRNASVTRLLLDNGAEWSPTAFASAVHWNDKESISMMAEAGDFVHFDSAAVGVSQETTLTNQQREAVLMAIRHCASGQAASANVVRWLLRHVAKSHDGDVFELDASDEQLLDAVRAGIGGAVRNDDVETALLLINNLPFASQSSESEQQTPDSRPQSLGNWLLEAVHRNAQTVTGMLLTEFSMDPNVVIGPHQDTPLTVAALAGHVEMIELLISTFDASIDKASGTYANGPTPLWHAIRSQNEAAVRSLFALGGPVELIHGLIKGGEKRLWLAAEKSGSYRSPVVVMAFMNPKWYDEDSGVRFLCLEFPDGFKSDLWIRKGDQDLLATGDDRPLMVNPKEGSREG